MAKASIINLPAWSLILSPRLHWISVTQTSLKVSSYREAAHIQYKKVLGRIINDAISKSDLLQIEILIRVDKKGYHMEEVLVVFVDPLCRKSKLGANELIAYDFLTCASIVICYSIKFVMDYEKLRSLLPKTHTKWTTDDLLLWLQFIGLESLSKYLCDLLLE
jgi:hypothetical protein